MNMGELDEDIDLDPINLKVEETKKEFTIVEYLNKSQLEKIHKIFKSAPKGGFKKVEFKSKVLTKFNINISDEDYEILFTKLDCDKNDFATWDEMVTYLVLELESKRKDVSKSVSIENSIVDEPQVINSGHRNAIIQIMFAPSVRLNGTIDYDDGKYLSMSKEGYLNVWSLDLKLLRTYRDKSLYPTVRGTCVMNFVCLPDLNVLVTSSIERELRFYDTTSKRFNLIAAFIAMPFCVSHMFYYFLENLKEESILVCGDQGGNIRVMKFPKEDKGPFKQKIGVDTLVLKWDEVVKGKLPLMKAYNILNVHSDSIKQVSYYKLLEYVVSCSTSPDAMFVGDFYNSKTNYQFVFKRGIETFCLSEDNPLIITGSLDCALRLWDPFNTKKPISVLRGHQASIVKIFLQDQGRKIFSFDKSRILKVWDSASQTCIQTYSGFAMKSASIREFSTYYNEKNHLFIVADFKIASTICGKLVDELRSDGTTHSGPVSFVFYNRLFRCVITCGTDSNIDIWDPWTNKRKSCIRKAHTSAPLGAHIPLPITAATLDPPHQYLLTGSSDGSIKMWDFNSGLCLRNMDIGVGQEVTNLIWQKNRILAVGENCQVIEFADSMGGKISGGKPWELKHSNEIISADFRPGQALATGTFNGDLILWRLETGQSYKFYNATHPTGFLSKPKAQKKGFTGGGFNKSSKKSSSRGKREKNLDSSLSKGKTELSFNSKKVSQRIHLVEKVNMSVERNLAIHCILFLKKREMLPDQATLLTSTENGMIQAWSHHPSGGFIVAFRAVHIERDYVVSMDSDPGNEFLFTGTVCGYIKIWLLKNYLLTATSEVHVCMPLYRLQFPFLIKDRILTRVKAALKNQPSPLLLSSYKGHIGAILSLDYVQECKIIFTSSMDQTVRIWTLSGRYIGCLGQNKPWLNLKWGVNPEETNTATDFRTPPEIVRSASYTTLKVLRGAPPIVTKKHEVEVDLSITEEERKLGVFGKKLSSPYLGRNHSFAPKLAKKKKLPPMDETMAKIPVFTHLVLSSWQPMPKFSTPQCIQNIKAAQTSNPSNLETRSGSVYQIPICWRKIQDATGRIPSDGVSTSFFVFSDSYFIRVLYASRILAFSRIFQSFAFFKYLFVCFFFSFKIKFMVFAKISLNLVLISIAITQNAVATFPKGKVEGKVVTDGYNASWEIIAEKVEQILDPEAKTIVTFEPLYSRVYRNVCNGFSEQMHFDLIGLCSRHLYSINQKLCSRDENSVKHFLTVHQDLRAYLLSVKIISSVFSYLNKFYVASCLNTDLCIQLSSLFSQIVISDRISTLMDVVEESLKTPFSIPPEILHNFFKELHEISNGEYSVKYLHLFSRYCPNVLPPMKESDLENHVMEVLELKKRQEQSQNLINEKHGVKRPAEEPVQRKMSYYHRQSKPNSVLFQ